MGCVIKQVEKRNESQALKQAEALLQEQAHAGKNIKPCPSVEEPASAEPRSRRAPGTRVPPRHRFPKWGGEAPKS